MPYTKGGMGPLYQLCPNLRRIWPRDGFHWRRHLPIKPVSDWRYVPSYSKYGDRCWVRDWVCEGCGRRWVSNFDSQSKQREEWAKRFEGSESMK